MKKLSNWGWIRGTSLGMCFVFTYVNIIYGAIEPAKNFWEDRKTAREKIAGEASKVRVPLPSSINTGLLAQLPALELHLLPNTLQNPGLTVPLPSTIQTSSDRPVFLSGRSVPSWLEALPASYVSIKDLYLPQGHKPGDLMVIHIQDAHGNVEAQRNIAKAIESLASNPVTRDSCLVSRNDKNESSNPRAASPRVPSHESRASILIGIEGARGAFNFAPYRLFPDTEITKQIADYFLKEGFITGSEYVGITWGLNLESRGLGTRDSCLEPLTSNPQPLIFWGIENESLYLSHVKTLKDSVANQKKAQEGIEKIAARLEAVKDSELNSELRDLDRKITLHHKGKIGLGEHLQYLTGTRGLGTGGLESRTTNPRATSHEPRATNAIQMFLTALKLEESLDYKKVEGERASLTRALAEKLPKSELQNLVKASLSYRLGNLTHGALYQYLKDLCSAYGILLGTRVSRAGGLETRATANYPEMDKYIRYVLLSEKIRAEDLLAEVESLEKKVIARAISNDRELEIMKQSKNLNLMEKLVKHELSPKEWEEYKKYRSRANGNPARADGNSVVGAQHAAPLQPFEKFNEIAIARNDVLVKNLLEKCNALHQKPTPSPGTRGLVAGGLEDSFLSSRVTNHEPSRHETRASNSQPLAVLVAGGFHTEGMMDILKNKKVAYAVLTPRLGKVEGTGSEYLDVFTRDKTPLEKLFTGERITLAGQSRMAPGMGGTSSSHTPVIENEFVGFFTLMELVRKLKTVGFNKAARREIVESISKNLEEQVGKAEFLTLKDFKVQAVVFTKDSTAEKILKEITVLFRNKINGKEVRSVISFTPLSEGEEAKSGAGVTAQIGNQKVQISQGSLSLANQVSQFFSRAFAIAKRNPARLWTGVSSHFSRFYLLLKGAFSPLPAALVHAVFDTMQILNGLRSITMRQSFYSPPPSSFGKIYTATTNRMTIIAMRIILKVKEIFRNSPVKTPAMNIFEKSKRVLAMISLRPLFSGFAVSSYQMFPKLSTQGRAPAFQFAPTPHWEPTPASALSEIPRGPVLLVHALADGAERTRDGRVIPGTAQKFLKRVREEFVFSPYKDIYLTGVLSQTLSSIAYRMESGKREGEEVGTPFYFKEDPLGGRRMAIYQAWEGNRDPGVIASPFAADNPMEVNPRWGTLADLEKAAHELRAAGKSLFVDGIPHSVGVDNSWLNDHWGATLHIKLWDVISPEVLAKMDDKELYDPPRLRELGLYNNLAEAMAKHNLSPLEPLQFFIFYTRPGDPQSRILIAHSREGGSATPWVNMAALDLTKLDARAYVREILEFWFSRGINVRADMVHLTLKLQFKDIWYPRLPWEEFERLWPAEFWEEARSLLEKHPNAAVMFEAYGYTNVIPYLRKLHPRIIVYEKHMMDLIVNRDIAGIKGYLNGVTQAGLQKSVHFIQNHDDSAPWGMGREFVKVAVAILATIPGILMIHSRQVHGLERIPVQNLVAKTPDHADEEIQRLHEELVSLNAEPLVQEGSLYLLKPDGFNPNLLAYSRTLGGEKLLVVANLSDQPQGAIVPFPLEWVVKDGSVYTFEDIYSPFKSSQDSGVQGSYEHEGADIRKNGGIYIKLAPTDAHIFRVSVKSRQINPKWQELLNLNHLRAAPVYPRGLIEGAGPVNELIKTGYLDRLAERSIGLTEKISASLVPENRQQALQADSNAQETVELKGDDTTYLLTLAWEPLAVRPGLNVQRIEGPQGADVFIAGAWQRFESKQESTHAQAPHKLNKVIPSGGMWELKKGEGGPFSLGDIKDPRDIHGHNDYLHKISIEKGKTFSLYLVGEFSGSYRNGPYWRKLLIEALRLQGLTLNDLVKSLIEHNRSASLTIILADNDTHYLSPPRGRGIVVLHKRIFDDFPTTRGQYGFSLSRLLVLLNLVRQLRVYKNLKKVQETADKKDEDAAEDGENEYEDDPDTQDTELMVKLISETWRRGPVKGPLLEVLGKLQDTLKDPSLFDEVLERVKKDKTSTLPIFDKRQTIFTLNTWASRVNGYLKELDISKKPYERANIEEQGKEIVGGIVKDLDTLILSLRGAKESAAEKKIKAFGNKIEKCDRENFSDVIKTLEIIKEELDGIIKTLELLTKEAHIKKPVNPDSSASVGTQQSPAAIPGLYKLVKKFVPDFTVERWIKTLAPRVETGILSLIYLFAVFGIPAISLFFGVDSASVQSFGNILLHHTKIYILINSIFGLVGHWNYYVKNEEGKWVPRNPGWKDLLNLKDWWTRIKLTGMAMLIHLPLLSGGFHWALGIVGAGIARDLHTKYNDVALIRGWTPLALTLEEGNPLLNKNDRKFSPFPLGNKVPAFGKRNFYLPFYVRTKVEFARWRNKGKSEIPFKRYGRQKENFDNFEFRGIEKPHLRFVFHRETDGNILLTFRDEALGISKSENLTEYFFSGQKQAKDLYHYSTTTRQFVDAILDIPSEFGLGRASAIRDWLLSQDASGKAVNKTRKQNIGLGGGYIFQVPKNISGKSQNILARIVSEKEVNSRFVLLFDEINPQNFVVFEVTTDNQLVNAATGQGITLPTHKTNNKSIKPTDSPEIKIFFKNASRNLLFKKNKGGVVLRHKTRTHKVLYGIGFGLDKDYQEIRVHKSTRKKSKSVETRSSSPYSVVVGNFDPEKRDEEKTQDLRVLGHNHPNFIGYFSQESYGYYQKIKEIWDKDNKQQTVYRKLDAKSEEDTPILEARMVSDEAFSIQGITWIAGPQKGQEVLFKGWINIGIFVAKYFNSGLIKISDKLQKEFEKEPEELYTKALNVPELEFFNETPFIVSRSGEKRKTSFKLLEKERSVELQLLKIREVSMKMTAPVDPRGLIVGAGSVNELIKAGYLDRLDERSIGLTEQFSISLVPEDRQQALQADPNAQETVEFKVGDTTYLLTLVWEPVAVSPGLNIQRIEGPQGADVFILGAWQRLESILNPKPFSDWSDDDKNLWNAIQGYSPIEAAERIRLIIKVNKWKMEEVSKSMGKKMGTIETQLSRWHVGYYVPSKMSIQEWADVLQETLVSLSYGYHSPKQPEIPGALPGLLPKELWPEKFKKDFNDLKADTSLTAIAARWLLWRDVNMLTMDEIAKTMKVSTHTLRMMLFRLKGGTAPEELSLAALANVFHLKPGELRGKDLETVLGSLESLTFGERVKALREFHGISNLEITDATDISPVQVRFIQRKRIKMLRKISAIPHLAQALQLKDPMLLVAGVSDEEAVRRVESGRWSLGKLLRLKRLAKGMTLEQVIAVLDLPKGHRWSLQAWENDEKIPPLEFRSHLEKFLGHSIPTFVSSLEATPLADPSPLDRLESKPKTDLEPGSYILSPTEGPGRIIKWLKAVTVNGSEYTQNLINVEFFFDPHSVSRIVGEDITRTWRKLTEKEYQKITQSNALRFVIIALHSKIQDLEYKYGMTHKSIAELKVKEIMKLLDSETKLSQEIEKIGCTPEDVAAMIRGTTNIAFIGDQEEIDRWNKELKRLKVYKTVEKTHVGDALFLLLLTLGMSLIALLGYPALGWTLTFEAAQRLYESQGMPGMLKALLLSVTGLGAVGLAWIPLIVSRSNSKRRSSPELLRKERLSELQLLSVNPWNFLFLGVLIIFWISSLFGIDLGIREMGGVFFVIGGLSSVSMKEQEMQKASILEIHARLKNSPTELLSEQDKIFLKKVKESKVLSDLAAIAEIIDRLRRNSDKPSNEKKYLLEGEDKILAKAYKLDPSNSLIQEVFLSSINPMIVNFAKYAANHWFGNGGDEVIRNQTEEIAQEMREFIVRRVIGKYNPDKGSKWSTYAYWWFKWDAINYAVANILGLENELKVKYLAQVLSVRKKLYNEFGRNPEIDEIAKKLKRSPIHVKKMLSLLSLLNLKSLSDPLNGDSLKTLEDVIPDPTSEDPSEMILIEHTVRQCLARLSVKDAVLLSLCYSEAEWTLEEIGQLFKITKQRIRVRKESIIKYLRKSIGLEKRNPSMNLEVAPDPGAHIKKVNLLIDQAELSLAQIRSHPPTSQPHSKKKDKEVPYEQLKAAVLEVARMIEEGSYRDSIKFKISRKFSLPPGTAEILIEKYRSELNQALGVLNLQSIDEYNKLVKERSLQEKQMPRYKKAVDMLLNHLEWNAKEWASKAGFNYSLHIPNLKLFLKEILKKQGMTDKELNELFSKKNSGKELSYKSRFQKVLSNRMTLEEIEDFVSNLKKDILPASRISLPPHGVKTNLTNLIIFTLGMSLIALLGYPALGWTLTFEAAQRLYESQGMPGMPGMLKALLLSVTGLGAVGLAWANISNRESIKSHTKKLIQENNLSLEDLLPPMQQMPSEVIKNYEALLGLRRNSLDQDEVLARRSLLHSLAILFNVEVAAIRTQTVRQNKVSVVSLRAEGFNVEQLLNSWKTHLAQGGKDENFFITFYSVSGINLEDAKIRLRESLAGHEDTHKILTRVQGIGIGPSDNLGAVYQKNLDILQNLAGKNPLIEYITKHNLAYLSESSKVVYKILRENFLLRLTPIEGVIQGVRLMDIQA